MTLVGAECRLYDTDQAIRAGQALVPATEPAVSRASAPASRSAVATQPACGGSWGCCWGAGRAAPGWSGPQRGCAAVLAGGTVPPFGERWVADLLRGAHRPRLARHAHALVAAAAAVLLTGAAVAAVLVAAGGPRCADSAARRPGRRAGPQPRHPAADRGPGRPDRGPAAALPGRGPAGRDQRRPTRACSSVT